MQSFGLMLTRSTSVLLQRLPGLALGAAVALAAIRLGNLPWLQTHGMSSLIIAILLGIALGNTLYPRLGARCGPGIGMARQTLLRTGIVLYGFRLTFHDVAAVGFSGILIDALLLSSTFGMALLLGKRVFGLDGHTTVLIGAGSAICGAAAVMASEPVVKARAEQVTIAVSTVVVFGTLAIAVYPLLYRWNLAWQVVPADAHGFGMYIGSTVHEVAQVLAVARAVSPEAADSAIIAKLVRVMMLAPFLLMLSVRMRRRETHCSDHPGTASPLAIPWFAFAFVGMTGLNTLLPLPPRLHTDLVSVDTWLLTISMAALGLTTHLSAIRQAGVKPLLLAALLFGWLIAGGAAVNRIVHGWVT
ncbi:MAG: YeiH family protein [Steroidobacteraceae bacterium]